MAVNELTRRALDAEVDAKDPQNPELAKLAAVAAQGTAGLVNPVDREAAQRQFDAAALDAAASGQMPLAIPQTGPDARARAHLSTSQRPGAHGSDPTRMSGPGTFGTLPPAAAPVAPPAAAPVTPAEAALRPGPVAPAPAADPLTTLALQMLSPERVGSLAAEDAYKARIQEGLFGLARGREQDLASERLASMENALREQEIMLALEELRRGPEAETLSAFDRAQLAIDAANAGVDISGIIGKEGLPGFTEGPQAGDVDEVARRLGIDTRTKEDLQGLSFDEAVRLKKEGVFDDLAEQGTLESILATQTEVDGQQINLFDELAAGVEDALSRGQSIKDIEKNVRNEVSKLRARGQEIPQRMVDLVIGLYSEAGA